MISSRSHQPHRSPSSKKRTARSNPRLLLQPNRFSNIFLEHCGCTPTREAIPNCSKRLRTRRWQTTVQSYENLKNNPSYEILSDPDKRSIYDARGEAGLSEQGGMGGMDPQVRRTQPNLSCTERSFRIFSASYSAVEDSAVAEDSSVAAVADPEIKALVKPKTLSTVSTSLWKTSTRARLQNSPSPGTGSAQNAKARVGRRAPSVRVTPAAVAVSRSPCAKWAR